jgi:hypothetical protein
MIFICQQCGAETNKRSDCKTWQSKYCSKECRAKFKKEAYQERNKMHQRKYYAELKDGPVLHDETSVSAGLSYEEKARKFDERQEKTRTYMRAYMKKRYQEKRKALLDKEIDNLEL